MPSPARRMQTLWRLLTQLDLSGDGPPWPLLVYNPDSGAFEHVGIVGGTGPAGPTGPSGPSGPQGTPGTRAATGDLELGPARTITVLDGGYLAAADGTAVLTAVGAPIQTYDLRVWLLPEPVLTRAGQLIGCGGP